MSYVTGIIAVTVSYSLIVLIASGGKYEKLVASVAAAVIALSVAAPAIKAIEDTDGKVERELVEMFSAKETDGVVARCCYELERRAESLIISRYPKAGDVSVTLEIDASDVSSIIITGAEVTVTGDAAGVGSYVADMFGCKNVNIIQKEGG